MTSEYTRNVLKLVVAQVCQTIGWHSVNSTPLEFLVDLLQEYILQLSKLTQQYAQVLGRCEANLDDLGLAFRHMNIDLQDLAEYVKNVDAVPCAIAVPKLPIYRESHLNFLKPGSREVVTRQVHVHEHLPAMYPNTEEEYQQETEETEIVNIAAVSEPVNISEDDTVEINNTITTNGVQSDENTNKAIQAQAVFKRPGDPISFDGPVVKRAKTTEEGRPLREIHSVIMTTSGFLSTAREGKLPEARTPQQARAESPPPPPTYPMVPPEVKVEKKLKKISKKIVSEDGKPENKENKKKKIPKEKDTLFQPDQIKEVKVKKLAGMKELAKLKALKPGSKASSPNLAGPSSATGKIQGKVPGGSPKHTKNIGSSLKIKTEKVAELVQNTVPPLLVDCKEEPIDKLPIEPDKQKLNIFKKISSKPKEDKDKDLLDSQQKLKELGSRENSPSLTPEENERFIKQEDKKPIAQSPLVNNNVVRTPTVDDSITDMMSPGSDVYMFDDMSPPGTPSTPKTPELSMPNVPLEQKKKKKEKTGKKKEPKPKTPRNSINPKKPRLSNDSVELNVMDRPKTPQAPEQPMPPIRDPTLHPALPFPFFPSFPAAPGLIPRPMFPLPMHKNIPGMGVPPNPVMPGMLRQRFFRPKLDMNRPLVPPSFGGDGILQPPISPVFPLKQPLPPQQPMDIVVKPPKITRSPEETMPSKSAVGTFLMPEVLAPPPVPINNASIPAPLAPLTISPVVPAPLLPSNSSLSKPFKPEKTEKSEKKSKERKKDKKDKLKKKKEKKEKHKDKGEKVKEKKDKSEKKEKLEKIKEKKDKKEKRKEKLASKKLLKEEKNIESVPKITLKLGPAGGSPRPPTPDSALMKKITIKPPKKPEDEVKREPTPELARISALVTRPPKQKSTSKKAEQSLLEAYPALPSEASLSSLTLVPTLKAKKPVFKTMPHKPPSPVSFDSSFQSNSYKSPESTQYCFTDPTGRKIWICPACVKQDDGSPMIGCDGCDAWYHWDCVGIVEEPSIEENWYCRSCREKTQYNDKKKKKRKKKVKVTA